MIIISHGLHTDSLDEESYLSSQISLRLSSNDKGKNCRSAVRDLDHFILQR